MSIDPVEVIADVIETWSESGESANACGAHIIDILATAGWHVVPGTSSLATSFGCLVAACPFPVDEASAYCEYHGAAFIRPRR